MASGQSVRVEAIDARFQEPEQPSLPEHPSKTGNGLFDMPDELLNYICALVVVGERPIKPHSVLKKKERTAQKDVWKLHPPPPGLLHMNKRLRTTTRPMYYVCNLFAFDGRCAGRGFKSETKPHWSETWRDTLGNNAQYLRRGRFERSKTGYHLDMSTREDGTFEVAATFRMDSDVEEESCVYRLRRAMDVSIRYSVADGRLVLHVIKELAEATRAREQSRTP